MSTLPELLVKQKLYSIQSGGHNPQFCLEGDILSEEVIAVMKLNHSPSLTRGNTNCLVARIPPIDYRWLNHVVQRG